MTTAGSVGSSSETDRVELNPATAILSGNLTLGNILDSAGLVRDDVIVLRHTYTEDGLRSLDDLTPARVLEYTRWQGIGNKLGRNPPQIWLIFMADGRRRSRFLTAYDNHGELPAQRSGDLRLFDLRPSQALSALADRLVVDWSKDAVNWAKGGETPRRFLSSRSRTPAGFRSQASTACSSATPSSSC